LPATISTLLAVRRNSPSTAADAAAPGVDTGWYEPLSRTTLPVLLAGSGAYGNFPGFDTGVSGSMRWRRSFHTEKPLSGPSAS
jgi:hypothetical protein